MQRKSVSQKCVSQMGDARVSLRDTLSRDTLLRCTFARHFYVSLTIACATQLCLYTYTFARLFARLLRCTFARHFYNCVAHAIARDSFVQKCLFCETLCDFPSFVRLTFSETHFLWDSLSLRLTLSERSLRVSLRESESQRNWVSEKVSLRESESQEAQNVSERVSLREVLDCLEDFQKTT